MIPAVACHGLGVTVGGTPILHEIEITVAAGDWHTIIGPNGAGKSTLLGAIAGVLPTSAGHVEVHGIAVDGLDARARARAVALVVQTPTIPRGLSVEDYVLLGRTPHLRRIGVVGDADRQIVDGLLARLDLRRFRGRRIDSLSGGERQRAVLARALAQQAPVLLLDEPTSALDIGFQQDVLDVVDELRHELGLTVVATMHDLTLSAQYSDQLALLDGGRVVDTGDPLELLDPDRLGETFGARVDVLQLDGRLLVTPTRRRRPRTRPDDSKGTSQP